MNDRDEIRREYFRELSDPRPHGIFYALLFLVLVAVGMGIAALVISLF